MTPLNYVVNFKTRKIPAGFQIAVSNELCRVYFVYCTLLFNIQSQKEVTPISACLFEIYGL